MSGLPNIYSCRKGSEPAPPDAVYIGRGFSREFPDHSVWANPYKAGVHGNAAEIVGLFELYALRRLEREPEWLNPLRDRPLLCWCKPKPSSRIRCHGEVLVRLANGGERVPVENSLDLFTKYEALRLDVDFLQAVIAELIMRHTDGVAERVPRTGIDRMIRGKARATTIEYPDFWQLTVLRHEALGLPGELPENPSLATRRMTASDTGTGTSSV